MFFDVETTGLPAPGKDVGITELACVAVSREHFEASRGLPFRVLHKLVLCVKPQAPMDPVAARISGGLLHCLIAAPRYSKSGDLARGGRTSFRESGVAGSF